MRICVAGVSGRMGRMIVQAAAEAGDVQVTGAIEAPGHDWIGREIGGAIVADDPDAALVEADVAIDFTAPKATLRLLDAAARRGVAHVIGTTGFAASDLDAIARASRQIPIMRSGNMSLGVNLLAALVRRVAARLDDGFDIEIVEAHHRHKADAPSGTALMLGQAAAEGRGRALDEMAERGRDGTDATRRPGAIGFAAIRGGEIIGRHDVLFAGAGEVLTLRHEATDRALFAHGALAAARWVRGQPPGEYDMTDVLDLDR